MILSCFITHVLFRLYFSECFLLFTTWTNVVADRDTVITYCLPAFWAEPWLDSIWILTKKTWLLLSLLLLLLSGVLILFVICSHESILLPALRAFVINFFHTAKTYHFLAIPALPLLGWLLLASHTVFLGPGLPVLPMIVSCMNFEFVVNPPQLCPTAHTCHSLVCLFPCLDLGISGVWTEAKTMSEYSAVDCHDFYHAMALGTLWKKRLLWVWFLFSLITRISLLVWRFHWIWWASKLVIVK